MVPKAQLSDWNIIIEQQSSVTLRIPTSAVMDRAAARRIGWQAWLAHYETKFTEARSLLELHHQLEEDPGPQRGRIGILALEVLTRANIIDDNMRLDPKFSSHYLGALETIKAGGRKEDEPPPEDMAATLALLAWLNDMTGLGAPTNMLDMCGGTLSLWITSGSAKLQPNTAGKSTRKSVKPIMRKK
jgi:hypothetical protein